jgi:hypothetical protein
MQARVEWARQRQGSFRLEILEPDQRPLENWNALVDAADEVDAPAGRLFPPTNRYAMAIPLHNTLPGHPQRHIVAYLGLTRDTATSTRRSCRRPWRLLPLLLVGVLAFGSSCICCSASGRGDAAAPADRRHRRRVQGRPVARGAAREGRRDRQPGRAGSTP